MGLRQVWKIYVWKQQPGDDAESFAMPMPGLVGRRCTEGQRDHGKAGGGGYFIGGLIAQCRGHIRLNPSFG